jgi:hypothetical protein
MSRRVPAGLLVFAALSACAGAPPPPPARPAAAPKPAPASAPVCGAEGPQVVLRGRVAVGPTSQPGFDSWIDLEVEGAQSDAAPICEAFVSREARRVYPPDTGLSARVVRPCSGAPLPATAPSPQPSYVLADRRAANVVVDLIADLTTGCQMTRAERTRAFVSSLSRFAGKRACEQARDRLKAAQQDADARAEREANAFLREQQHELEAEEVRACAGEDTSTSLVTQQMVAVGLKRAYAEETHRLDQLRATHGEKHPNVQVSKATVAELRRELDTLEADIDTRRKCKSTRTMLQVLRGRSGRPGPAPAEPLRAACRPE